MLTWRVGAVAMLCECLHQGEEREQMQPIPFQGYQGLAVAESFRRHSTRQRVSELALSR
jgi:hypothetical protein